MEPSTAAILTINGGSTSLKFALFGPGDPPDRRISGQVERIGGPESTLVVVDPASSQRDSRSIAAPDHETAVLAVLDALGGAPISAIGHRVVHGGPNHFEPERITPGLLDDLRAIRSYDPDHLPAEIALIEAVGAHYPRVPQFACFDTAFHRDMPRVARLLPLPRRLDDSGVRKFGFHGLSYEYLMRKLAEIGQSAGRVVLAHLGGGASLAAVKDGESIDTTMGLTPAAGLVMATRSGDVDPGLVGYLARSRGLSAEGFDAMINHESGLLGVSGSSGDLRDLLAREADDIRAAEAVDLFCYQAKKWLAAMAATLGGLDTLVFSGGIGEHAPEVRSRICEGLEFLGVRLDASLNRANSPLISAEGGGVAVRVIATDEESTIARAVASFPPEE